MSTDTESRAGPAHRAGRRAQLRQDGAVQPPDGQPPEGRQLPGRHRRAQGRQLQSTPRAAAATAYWICPAPTASAATTLDEAITRDVVAGRLAGEAVPELIVNVLDATNLRLKPADGARSCERLGRPMVDRAQHERHRARRGIRIDCARLAAASGVPGRRDRGGAQRRRARAAGALSHTLPAPGGSGASRGVERRRRASRSRPRNGRCAASWRTCGYREPLRSTRTGAALDAPGPASDRWARRCLRSCCF